MTTLHPLRTTEVIRASYLRYLKTIYPFQRQSLRDAFWEAVAEPGRLVKGPLLEAAPPFALGPSIRDLVDEGLLHPGFARLCSPALPYARPLYQHQVEAVRHVVGRQRNLIVATGTGSGKTESFLLPILDHLLREEEAGTLGEPGVRALLLYPMNALANDQLKRLRRMLDGYPAITFGRYTGETETDDGPAEERFVQQFPQEPRLSNELISRKQLRARPPHLLLTNYAMLEYLLLRPEDCEFFDGETGRHWRFIVLDEAHVYDGASGIEIAMLLRRLKDRIVGSATGRLRCLATSATLGRGRADFPAAADFAATLFGEPFAWDEADPDRQDVVQATRMPAATLGPRWGEGSPALYAALRETVERLSARNAGGTEVVTCLAEAAGGAVPAPVLAEATAVAHRILTDGADDDEHARRQRAVDAFLHALLAGDGRLSQLHDLLCDQPALLTGAARELLPDDPAAEQALVDLVDLAVRARPAPDSLSLLPARYHVFARALEGAFACLNEQAHADGRPRLFLSRRERCPDCDSWVLELATCTRCGATYAVGRETRDEDDDAGPPRFTLQPLTADVEGLQGRRAYFLLGEAVAAPDEDEAVAETSDLLDTPESEDLFTLCLACGEVVPGRLPQCRCSARGPVQPVRKAKLNKEGEPSRCLDCGSRNNGTLIYRFLTGQDAPPSVLATALYQQLPPSSDPLSANLPGQGRKLLIFSDSRQDAAFFAPYLERTYSQIMQRRLLLQALLDDPDGRAGMLRLQDAVMPVQRAAERAGLFSQRQSSVERRRLAATWLMQELVALERRLSLEGLGLLQFRLVRPERWRPPAALQAPPWQLGDDECWELMALLLDSLRRQGVVSYLDGVDPTGADFAPRNRRIAVRGDRSDARLGVLSWVPTASTGSNGRLDLLERLLDRRQAGLTPTERRQVALEALRGLWSHLTVADSCWRDHLVAETTAQLGTTYRLSHEFWELVPSATGIGYRCRRCRAVTPYGRLGVCPTIGCGGALVPLDPTAPDLADHHYRELYLGFAPVPLTVEEHTAQWTSDEAGKVQERFVRGEINALSCSTTFELGVDVGELQAVLMRNVPPTTANYVQRAGRAGRRTESAAFALTYAQRRSHDLTHYGAPDRLVAGRITPPRIRLTNTKIVRRHAQAVLIAAFLRDVRERTGRLFPDVGSFFQPAPDQPDGASQLKEFAEARPEVVGAALPRIVPPELHAELDLANWGWLYTPTGDGMLDLLARAVAEVTGDLKLYDELIREAAAERKFKRSDYYQGVIRTICKRSLLGFLAARNLLPKYGFPTDLVELKTQHIDVPEATKVELQRDLRIAIAEYAPGAEVVAAKRVWTGGGLYKQPRKDWPVYSYGVCPRCGRFHFAAEEQAFFTCAVCSSPIQDRRRRYGTFIKPEFGFIAQRASGRPGERRPQRLYASRVYFAEYAPLPAANGEAGKPPELPLEPVSGLMGPTIKVEKRVSRFGRLVVVNSGQFGRGFRICQRCGYAELAPESVRTGKDRLTHKHPLMNRDCSGMLATRHLGHDFLTDVLELRLSGLLPAGNDETTWRSVLYALLEGAAAAFDIRRDDLDGTLHWHSPGAPPALMLFDDVPGGAGHVQRIADDLPTVFDAAYRRVDRDCCGPETSCYECLRTFRNQPYHDDLRRGLARDFLAAVIADRRD